MLGLVKLTETSETRTLGQNLARRGSDVQKFVWLARHFGTQPAGVTLAITHGLKCVCLKSGNIASASSPFSFLV